MRTTSRSNVGPSGGFAARRRAPISVRISSGRRRITLLRIGGSLLSVVGCRLSVKRLSRAVDNRKPTTENQIPGQNLKRIRNPERRHHAEDDLVVPVSDDD